MVDKESYCLVSVLMRPDFCAHRSTGLESRQVIFYHRCCKQNETSASVAFRRPSINILLLFQFLLFFAVFCPVWDSWLVSKDHSTVAFTLQSLVNRVMRTLARKAAVSKLKNIALRR